MKNKFKPTTVFWTIYLIIVMILAISFTFIVFTGCNSKFKGYKPKISLRLNY